MSNADVAEELNQERQHQLMVLRSRRKAAMLWLVLVLACLSLAVVAAISHPLLEQGGATWVLGLLAVAGAGFLYVISAVDKNSKSLWPRNVGHIREVMKSPKSRVNSQDVAQ